MKDAADLTFKTDAKFSLTSLTRLADIVGDIATGKSVTTTQNWFN